LTIPIIALIIELVKTTKPSPFDQRFTPEMKFLFAAARPFMTRKEGEVLHAMCAQENDWLEFTALIQHHRLTGLVFDNIERFVEAELPESFYQFLQQQAKHNRHREFILATEIVRLARLFEANGIEYIFFKGPILSQLIYNTLGLRHSRDLDVLIRTEKVDSAVLVLTANGYKIIDSLIPYSPRQKRYLELYQKHYTCINQETGNQLELHWRLMNTPAYLLPDFEQNAFARAINVDFGGWKVRTFSHLDNFLYLCAHGADHAWFRLKWLCDIAAAFRNPLLFDWESIAAATMRNGLERPVAQAAELSERLLGSPIPQDLQVTLRSADALLPMLIRSAERNICMKDSTAKTTGQSASELASPQKAETLI